MSRFLSTRSYDFRRSINATCRLSPLCGDILFYLLRFSSRRMWVKRSRSLAIFISVPAPGLNPCCDLWIPPSFSYKYGLSFYSINLSISLVMAGRIAIFLIPSMLGYAVSSFDRAIIFA
jgi:hypothetical protein